MPSQSAYAMSAAAREASAYFNSLSFEERAKLAPLLENYRQMGLAEVRSTLIAEIERIDERIERIRNA